MAPLKLDISTITNTTLHKTLLNKCNLCNVDLHNCTLTHCTIDNCKFYDCNIISSDLTDCKLFDGTVTKSRLIKTSSTSSMFDFAKVSIGIRWNIYKYCLVWDGKTPALLAALRAHKELYEEALVFFRSINVFCLSNLNKETRKEMPSRVFQKIKNLEIKNSRKENSIGFHQLYHLFRGQGSFESVCILLCQKYEGEVSTGGSEKWVNALKRCSPSFKSICVRYNFKCGTREEICDRCMEDLQNEYLYVHEQMYEEDDLKWDYSMRVENVEVIVDEDGRDGDETGFRFVANAYWGMSSEKKKEIEMRKKAARKEAARKANSWRVKREEDAQEAEAWREERLDSEDL